MLPPQESIKSDCPSFLPKDSEIYENTLETSEHNSLDIPSNISEIAENNSSATLENIQTTCSEQQANESTQIGLEKLATLKSKHFKNPCISYLNINSLRGDKFLQLKEMLTSVFAYRPESIDRNYFLMK